MKLVKLGTKSYYYYWGIAVLVEFEDLTGKSVMDLGSNMKFGDAVRLIYCAFKEGCRKKGIEFDMEWQDIADLIDKKKINMEAMINEYVDSLPKDEGGTKKK